MQSNVAITKEHSKKQSVGRQGLFFQPKLTVNQPNDRYEQEADAVAEKVMQKDNLNSGGSAFFNPLHQPQEKQVQQPELQLKKSDTVEADISENTEEFIGNMNRSGHSLPTRTRSFFEERMGQDFSNVKVHTDVVAAKSAQSINALAYTTGSNIVFNKEQYQPETDNGKRLLAHELTHVVQQKATPKSVQRSLANIGTTISAANQQAIRNRVSFWDVPLAPAVVSTGALEDYFRKSPPNASIGFSGTTVIDASVIQTTATPQSATFDVARGLNSLPGHFVSTHNMPQNSTATINMDLSSFGGQAGIFRITYLNANPGTSGAAQPQFHLEFVSATRTTPVLTARPGTFAVGGHDFTAIGWPDDRYDELIDVMNRLPATALSQIAGMRFRYRSQLLQTITQLGEDGEALLRTGVPANQREIIVWSTVTRPTILNYSGFTRTAYVVAHEIGHWLDFNPIFLAANGTAADSASGFYRLGANGALTEGANRRTRFSRLNSANPSVTNYGTTDLKESFAEYFAMYVTDPAQLRLLRPDVFAYFQTAYP